MTQNAEDLQMMSKISTYKPLNMNEEPTSTFQNVLKYRESSMLKMRNISDLLVGEKRQNDSSLNRKSVRIASQSPVK